MTSLQGLCDSFICAMCRYTVPVFQGLLVYVESSVEASQEESENREAQWKMHDQRQLTGLNEISWLQNLVGLNCISRDTHTRVTRQWTKWVSLFEEYVMHSYSGRHVNHDHCPLMERTLFWSKLLGVIWRIVKSCDLLFQHFLFLFSGSGELRNLVICYFCRMCL